MSIEISPRSAARKAEAMDERMLENRFQIAQSGLGSERFTKNVVDLGVALQHAR